MKLILYGIIIGIGKIIPGVSGSLLAISLGVYEKIIYAITHFFDKPKGNLKLLSHLGIGILSSIVLFSKIIIYLFNNYYFISIMFFLGLILSSVIKYMKKIKYNKKKLIIISIIIIILLSISNIKNNYIINMNSLMYLLAGVTEVFTSIIPGISGTAIFITLGIYDDILLLISNIYNINYILNNITNYLFYFIGMFISFILTTLLINYLYQKKKNIFEIIIISFTITSIILLIKSINYNTTIINLILGLITLTIGLLLGYIC